MSPMGWNTPPPSQPFSMAVLAIEMVVNAEFIPCDYFASTGMTVETVLMIPCQHKSYS